MSSHPFCGRYYASCMRILVALAVSLTAALCLRLPQVDAAPATPTPPASIFLPMVGNDYSGLPPSDDLIDGAVTRGEIDADTALVYKVYAAFADPRLPQQYRGDDRDVRDSMIMAEVNARFDSLPAQTQSLLAPFLLPPSAPGSWLEQREAGAQAGAGVQGPAAITWGKAPAVGNKAVVWYHHAGDQAIAEGIAQILTADVWPKLTGLMGREPKSDGLLTRNNGGDGRFDVYLVHFPPPTDPDKGWLAGQAPAYDPRQSGGQAGCQETPSYVLLDSRLEDKVLKSTLVHEFMHAIQWTFPVKVGCMYPGEYAWFAEASATWAEHYVYKGFQTEQEYAKYFLDKPYLPLEDKSGKSHVYGAYLWPFYLTQGQSAPSRPTVIRSIWEAFKDNTSLEAIDKSIPGGFKQQWAGFVLRNWNDGPVTDYQDWDELSKRVPPSQILELDGTLEGKRAVRELPLVEDIPHLTARYYRIPLDDPDVHRVTFFNGLNYALSEATVTNRLGQPWGNGQTSWQTLKWSEGSDENREYVNIWAIPRVSGVWKKPEDLTNLPYRTFCRDKSDEKVEALIVIISNSAWDDTDFKPQPDDLAPTLFYSNIPCDGWQGDIDSVAPLNEFPLQVAADDVKLAVNGLLRGSSGAGFYLVGSSYTATQGEFSAIAEFDVGAESQPCHVVMDYHAPVVGSMVVNDFALDDAFGRYTLHFRDDHIHGDMECPDGTSGPFPDPARHVVIWYLWVAAEDPPGENFPPFIRVLEPLHVSDDGKQIKDDKAIYWPGPPARGYDYHWDFAPDHGP